MVYGLFMNVQEEEEKVNESKAKKKKDIEQNMTTYMTTTGSYMHIAYAWHGIK